MTSSRHKLSVELSEEDYQEVVFLYKHFGIETTPISTALRKFFHSTYSLLTEEQKQSDSSRTEESQLELLDDWDCAYRALVPVWNKFKQRDEMKIHCSATDTRRILGTNIIHISICKKCHDRGASTNFIAIPAPKKVEKPQSASKPQSVQKQNLGNRKCLDCGCNISMLEDWKTRCASCYRKKQNPAWQGDAKPLAGSPLDLRMKEAEAIRRAHEEINEKNDTKTEE
jgi:hypothetical protein